MQKNQKILLAIIGIVVVLAGIVGFLAFKKEKEQPKIKTSRFKEEYEKLNGVVDDEGYTYPTVDITASFNVKYITEQEILNILTKDGVIYFGTAKSFDSRNAVTSLIKAADSISLDKIYYYDTENFDPTTEEYREIMEKIDSVLKVKESVNDEGEKVATVSKELIIPTVIIVKDGEIVDYHVGVLEKENSLEELTKEEQESLFTVYTSKLLKLASSACNENSRC